MVTSEEHLQNLVSNAFGREMEVYAYQVNVDNYTTMLEALPLGPWPKRLEDYRATPIEQLPVDMSDDDVSLVADFQYRDRITGLLRTEKVEQGKARRVLEALKSQIGEDYGTLVAAHKSAQA